MKFLINKKYLFLLAVIVAVGCKKSLELSPKDQLSDVSFWKSPNDFQLAANNFYYGLQQVPEYIDNNSDIAFGSGANPVSNGSYLPAATSAVWDSCYKQIRGTNYLLTKAPTSNLGTAIDRWVGEAEFFRAYNYWRLVKTFGGVPKIDKVLDVTSPELYSQRATQAEIVDFILSDLDNAIPKLPKQSQLTADEEGRVTQGAALALKARVALYEGTWAKYHGDTQPDKYIAAAVDAAQQVVSSSEYTLYTDQGAQSYKYLFIQQGDDSKESPCCINRYLYSKAMTARNRFWRSVITPIELCITGPASSGSMPWCQQKIWPTHTCLPTDFRLQSHRCFRVIIHSRVSFKTGIRVCP